MTIRKKTELLFLHALPLDGSMWAAQKQRLPGSTYTPTLYPFSDSIEAWAVRALNIAKGDRLVVVGCSVGGSCALELAAIAPGRVAGIVLITRHSMPQRSKRVRPRDWRKPGKSSGLHCFHLQPTAR